MNISGRARTVSSRTCFQVRQWVTPLCCSPSSPRRGWVLLQLTDYIQGHLWIIRKKSQVCVCMWPMGGPLETPRRVSVNSWKFPQWPWLCHPLPSWLWCWPMLHDHIWKISNKIILNMRMKPFWGWWWVEPSYLKACPWTPAVEAAQLIHAFHTLPMSPSNKSIGKGRVSFGSFLKKRNWCGHETWVILGRLIW